MTTYPLIEETIAERRSRLVRESAELERDELREENARLHRTLDRVDPQRSKKVF